jgi:hypothetical protein
MRIILLAIILARCGGSGGAPGDSTGCENMGGERVCKEK